MYKWKKLIFYNNRIIFDICLNHSNNIMSRFEAFASPKLNVIFLSKYILVQDYICILPNTYSNWQLHFYYFPIFVPLSLIINRTKAFNFDFIDKKLQKRVKKDCYKQTKSSRSIYVLTFFSYLPLVTAAWSFETAQRITLQTTR